MNQDDVRVERYVRTGEREWILTEAIGAEDSIVLDSIACTLTMSDLYEDID